MSENSCVEFVFSLPLSLASTVSRPEEMYRSKDNLLHNVSLNSICSFRLTKSACVRQDVSKLSSLFGVGSLADRSFHLLIKFVANALGGLMRVIAGEIVQAGLYDAP